MGPGRWWHDHRAIYRLKDGQWVPAPRRIERTWAWFMHRGKPVRPPPRIFWFIWIGLLVANDAWSPDWAWWLFQHPQVAAGIRIGLYVMAAVGAAGAVFVLAWAWIGERRRKRDDL